MLSRSPALEPSLNKLREALKQNLSSRPSTFAILSGDPRSIPTPLPDVFASFPNTEWQDSPAVGDEPQAAVHEQPEYNLEDCKKAYIQLLEDFTISDENIKSSREKIRQLHLERERNLQRRRLLVEQLEKLQKKQRSLWFRIRPKKPYEQPFLASNIQQIIEEIGRVDGWLANNDQTETKLGRQHIGLLQEKEVLTRQLEKTTRKEDELKEQNPEEYKEFCEWKHKVVREERKKSKKAFDAQIAKQAEELQEKRKRWPFN
ncbi:MAG: hypothetical protein LBF72_02385 [Holosporales bacterium]|nr:hypothetical protein [Holosporales bacterium]